MLLEHQITTMTHRLACETAAIKVWLALRSLDAGHWEDEPRIPRGRREGGQWTTEASVTATLLDQRVGVGDNGLIRHCTYVDPDGNMTTKVIDAMDLCPPTIKVRKRYG